MSSTIKIVLPYAIRQSFEQFLKYPSPITLKLMTPLVTQWQQRILGAAGREIISDAASGRAYRTTMTYKLHCALVTWAKRLLIELQKRLRFDEEDSFGTVDAKIILEWLATLVIKFSA